ncbi:MAG: hypothetical protein H2069_01510 [Legionella sp.]|nr:hypothetical protein [Legionella sp.]
MDLRSINSLLNNPKAFKHAIKNWSALADTAKEFPSEAKILLTHVLNNNHEFSRLFQSIEDVYDFAISAPAYANVVVEHILSNQYQFRRLIDNYDALVWGADFLPVYTNGFLEYVLNDGKLFRNIFNTYRTLRKAATNYPSYSKRLSDYVADNEREFNRLILTAETFVSFHRWSGMPAATAIKRIMANGVQFKSVIKDLADLYNITTKFPHFTSSIIEYVLNTGDHFDRLFKVSDDVCIGLDYFPQYAEQLIEKILIHPEGFEQLIICPWVLLKIAKVCPQKVNVVIERVLNNQNLFIQIVKRGKLEELIAAYPMMVPQLVDVLVMKDIPFVGLVPSIFFVEKLAIAAPPCAKRLIEHILNYESIFNTLIYHHSSLMCCLQTFPAEKNAILAQVSLLDHGKDPAPPFLIAHLNAFITTAKRFPEDLPQLKTYFLENPARCKRLISSLQELSELNQAFPVYAQPLVERVINDKDEFLRLVNPNSFQQVPNFFPEHANAFVELILSDLREFKRLIQSGDQWLCAVNKFPSHEVRLLGCVLENFDEFKRLIPNASDFCKLAQNFPSNTASLVIHLQKENEVFNFLITSYDDLYTVIEVTKKFAPTQPHFVDVLVNKVLKDKKLLTRILCCPFVSLLPLMKECPAMKPFIMAYILDDKNEFKRLVTDRNIIAIIKELSPLDKKCLADFILDNDDVFRSVFYFAEDWLAFAQACASEEKKILAYVLRNPHRFKRIIKNVDVFKYLVRDFPDYADRVIQPLLNDEETLKYYISSNVQMETLTKLFPKIDMLKFCTREEILDAMRNKKEIQTAVINLTRICFFSKSSTNKTGEFDPIQQKLSYPMLCKIAVHFADPLIYSEKAALQIAQDQYKAINTLLKKNRPNEINSIESSEIGNPICNIM